MATCAHCKTQETHLYEKGVPICLACADGHTKSKTPATQQQILSTLLQDVFEFTARAEKATEEFEAVMEQTRSGHPDGVQRIKNASSKLSIARKELMKAHRRLDEHSGSGIFPEDLKRSAVGG